MEKLIEKALGVLVVALLLILVINVYRQSPFVSGVVTSADTSEPLEGVVITIGDQTTTTSAHGSFVLILKQEGMYTLSTELKGYAPYSQEFVVKTGSPATFNIALQHAFTELATVRGTVRDATTNQPITGAHIAIAGLETDTDSHGNFEITQLPPGKQQLSVTRKDYRFYRRDLVIDESAQVVFDIVLSPELPVTSAVNEETSEIPEPEAPMESYQIVERVSSMVTAGAGGTLSVVEEQSLYSDGFVISIPPNALEVDTYISIGDVVSSFPPIPEGCHPAGLPISLKPDGLTFDRPVTIKVPYCDEILKQVGIASPEQLILKSFDSTTGQWVDVPLKTIDQENKLVVAEVEHFSLFGLFDRWKGPETDNPATEEHILRYVSEAWDVVATVDDLSHENPDSGIPFKDEIGGILTILAMGEDMKDGEYRKATIRGGEWLAWKALKAAGYGWLRPYALLIEATWKGGQWVVKKLDEAAFNAQICAYLYYRSSGHSIEEISEEFVTDHGWVLTSIGTGCPPGYPRLTGRFRPEDVFKIGEAVWQAKQSVSNRETDEERIRTAFLKTLAVPEIEEPPSSACTLTVQAGESIQEAIDRALDSAVICLEPGSYKETLVIKKSLTLCGSSDSPDEVRIIGLLENQPVIWVESNSGISVNFRNLTVTKGGGGGLWMEGSSKVFIQNSTISNDATYGLVVQNGAQAIIEESLVENNGRSGLSLGEEGSASIGDSVFSGNKESGILVGSAHLAIENSTVSDNGHAGIYLVGESVAQIKNSHILRNEFYGIAVYLEPCQDPCIDYYKFTGQVTGTGNTIPGPDKPDGNKQGALCPSYPGEPWPEGFLTSEEETAQGSLVSPGIIADESDTGPLGDRIPVILIHGMNSENSERERWQDFILCLLDTAALYEQAHNGDIAFGNHFKIYRFKYGSRSSIDESGNALGRAIDAAFSDGQEVALVGHGMGGLVARAYMNHYVSKEGPFAGQKGGERVIVLFTLGTPHHGTPWATVDWTAYYFDTYSPLAATSFFEIYRRSQLAPPTLGFLNLSWDNFDNALPLENIHDSSSIYGLEEYDYRFISNEWLSRLNEQDQYLNKYVVYASYDNDLSDNATAVEAVLDYCFFDEGSSDLSYLTYKLAQFPTWNSTDTYQANDGIVPLCSALFLKDTNGSLYKESTDTTVQLDHPLVYGQQQVLRQRYFPGFDHAQLIGLDLHDPLKLLFVQMMGKFLLDLNDIIGLILSEPLTYSLDFGNVFQDCLLGGVMIAGSKIVDIQAPKGVEILSFSPLPYSGMFALDILFTQTTQGVGVKQQLVAITDTGTNVIDLPSKIRAREDAKATVLFFPSPLGSFPVSDAPPGAAAFLSVAETESIAYSYTSTLPSALERFDEIVVLAQMYGGFLNLSDSDIDRLMDYVTSGGTVIVFADASFTGAIESANRILAHCGAQFVDGELLHESTVDSSSFGSSPLFAGVSTLHFWRPTPIIAKSESVQIIVPMPQEDRFSRCWRGNSLDRDSRLGYVALCSYADGHVVAIGESLVLTFMEGNLGRACGCGDCVGPYQQEQFQNKVFMTNLFLSGKQLAEGQEEQPPEILPAEPTPEPIVVLHQLTRASVAELLSQHPEGSKYWFRIALVWDTPNSKLQGVFDELKQQDYINDYTLYKHLFDQKIVITSITQKGGYYLRDLSEPGVLGQGIDVALCTKADIQVTGIQKEGNHAKVEYTWRCEETTPVFELLKPILASSSFQFNLDTNLERVLELPQLREIPSQAFFTLYDDGWRLKEVWDDFELEW